MSQEARNTERHGNWSNAKLRDQKVAFVSAGNLTRQEVEVEETEETEETGEATEKEVSDYTAVQDNSVNNANTAEIVEHLGKTALSDPAEDPVTHFCEQPPQTNGKPRQSFSSDVSEEIIFSGRAKPTVTPEASSHPLKTKPFSSTRTKIFSYRRQPTPSSSGKFLVTSDPGCKIHVVKTCGRSTRETQNSATNLRQR